MIWLERYGIREEYVSSVEFDMKLKKPYRVLKWVEKERYTLNYYC
jgi:hypothetical protein